MTESRATDNKNLENRVLVLMPTGRDAALVCRTLENSKINAETCKDAAELEAKVTAGAGALLVAEEALQNGTLKRLVEVFEDQPVWSDVPVVLFAGNTQNSEKLLELVGTRFNATIVERPIRITMLVSAVRGALRARARQYQARDLLNQLKEADKQKDLFLATLSHELRTPLNSILGWIQLLRSGSEGVDRRRGLDVIERNARTQSEIISDILFVSRIITGKLELSIVPVDLSTVVRESIEVVLPSAQAKGIRINAVFDPAIGQISGDQERLKQVFWNILSNAVKFTPPDGRIDIRADLDGASARVEISDSGQGIEAKFLPLIFERFSQADSSYTRQVGGLGLGLAIVRHLVEMHGGSVGVQSRGTDQGASFTVSLPVAGKRADSTSENNFGAPPAPAVEAPNPPQGIRILLVEDNDDSREMLKVLFTQHDLEITATASAAEALMAFEESTPDILISDIGLPGIDGYQLIRAVREFPPEHGGRVPAIALTGYASLQDRELALEAGYQEHLSKPIDIEELFALVNKLLDVDLNAQA